MCPSCHCSQGRGRRNRVRRILVVEVEYRQRLQDRLRHALLNGIRPDKEALIDLAVVAYRALLHRANPDGNHERPRN